MMLAALLLQAVTGIDARTGAWNAFHAVCIEKRAITSNDYVRPARSAELPAEARYALGRNLVDAGLLASIGINFTVSASEDFSNPVYALGEPDGFLILSMPEAKKMTGMSGMCAVVMKGDHYLDALRAVDPNAAAKLEKKLSHSDKTNVTVPEYRRRAGNHEISIVEVGGWTSAAVNSDR